MKIKENQHLNQWFYNHSYFLSAISFIVVFLLAILVAHKDLTINKEKELEKSEAILDGIKSNIDNISKTSYVTTLSLALTIDSDGVPQNFEQVAKKLYESNENIDGLELVPDGIVKYVYPYEENKDAIGLNILEYKYSQKEAYKAIETRKMYFGGPLKFKQGGFGIIGRLPIFIEDEFWGYSAILINLNNFLEKSGINELDDKGLNYCFAKINPNTGEKEFFNNYDKGFDFENSKKITFEDADWEIYLAPQYKNLPYLLTSPFAIFGFFLALGFALLVYVILQAPAQLQRFVKYQASKLISSEVKYKAIFNEAGIGIIHLDERERFLEANQRFLNITGYSFKEISKMKLSKMIVLKNQSLHKILNHEKFEGKLICKNKQRKIVTVTNSALKINNQITHILLIEDITKRKEADKQLKDLQAKMQMAIRISKIGYWEWEPEEDKIKWSEYMYEIFGFNRDQHLNSDIIYNSIYNEDKKRYSKVLNKLSANKKGKTLEFRILNGNEEIRHIMSRVECEVLENGKLKLMGTTIDVTDKKQTLINLQHSYQMVKEQNDRLLNFSYIVSHNLRSHTSNIQGLIELIRDLETLEEKREMFNILAEVTDSLDETLHDLNEVIHIQKTDEGLIEDIKLSVFISRIKNILKREIIENNVIINDQIPDEKRIRFNPAYLESVLLNIISNAIKYRNKHKESEINIIFREEENFNVLEIIDNGIGIDLESNKGQLFGMYQTFTDFKNSRGIGLFVSNNQMKAMGGKIEIKSKLNEGTVFTLYFKK